MTAAAAPHPNATPTAASEAGADSRPSSTAIVGGGPTGLAVALMLARRGYRDISVMERLNQPPPPSSPKWDNAERSYNLGIGGRGQVALAKLGAVDRVLDWCAEAVGRKDWNPQTPDGAERIFSERKYKTKVIARDRLASCLLEEIREKHSDAVTVRFDVECTGAKWLEPGGKGSGATLSIRDTSGGETSELTADFVVAADGVKSAIRDALEGDKALTRALSGGDVRVKRFPRVNEFAYKVVPFKLDAGWRNDFNYSHRTKGGITLEALPTKEGGQVGVLLFRPDDERILGLKDAADGRALFEELFPQFAGMVKDEAYERLALQEVSRLPAFSYTGPVLHLGKSAVLLGDAIKSVKPYFGLGVNTAFEDCIALDRCLEETGDDLAAALPLYSRRRAPEAKDLVELSRGFDRTGVAGFFGFILPLILDSVFHNALPKVFAPNTIAFLQREGITFRGIRRRKGLDRVMQGVVLMAAGVAAVSALRVGAGALGPLVASAFAAIR
ncbi:Kynurenine 3-Monooxygenase [Ectocarpus siliculosus]|uniref:Kynurenine 3-Monooxygenase n=1 Tax=Ectocarpus siliculosus TaxID=2880 RepID=D7FXQ1_ECTSI|nr:Kynurenine 3-Monooxygenase [Ectocarpus siliculosus]|eukprot:CBJ26418.1 Kynurenine 3-Monooxygenase [Ectocarpus siliculosus]